MQNQTAILAQNDASINVELAVTLERELDVVELTFVGGGDNFVNNV
jgi:hypothetical protein